MQKAFSLLGAKVFLFLWYTLGNCFYQKKQILMPTFLYTAKNKKTGETINGEVNGQSDSTVASQLRGEGLLVTSIFLKDTVKKKSIFAGIFGRVSLKDRMVFARNLSVMIGSGLSIARALKNLQEQVESEKFQLILKDVHGDVSRGTEFSDALSKHPNTFDDMFVSMVRVGEESGTLDQALTIVADQMEKDHDLISKVRGALIYPGVIVVAMIIVAVIMFTFVLPQITTVFKELDAELPAMTVFVIALSDFMKQYSLLVVAGMVGMGLFAKVTWKNVAFGRMRSRLVLKLPIFSGIVVKVNAARFSRIYSSLLRSGVPVLRSLQIISDTLSTLR